MVGNSKLVSALKKLKVTMIMVLSHLFKLRQLLLLRGPKLCFYYQRYYKKRRDVMIQGLSDIWSIDILEATMYLWAKIPEEFKNYKSLEFSKLLIKKLKLLHPRDRFWRLWR